MARKILKFTLIVALGLSMGNVCRAQMAKWLIHPQYDDVRVKCDRLIFEMDSIGHTVLWSFDGKRLFSTEDSILQYHENVAIVMDKKTKQIDGVVDMFGKYVEFPQANIVNGVCRFDNGCIVTHRQDEGYFIYSLDGNVFPVTSAKVMYPMHKGIAPYISYLQDDKTKDLYYTYANAFGKKISYVVNDKVITEKDIKFLSGIGKDGKGVAIFKNKLYWFDSESFEFSPMMLEDAVKPSKQYHLSVEDDVIPRLSRLGSNGLVLESRIGKKCSAKITFDEDIVPVEYEFNSRKITFDEDSVATVEYESWLSGCTDGDKQGILFMDAPLLPGQFDTLGLFYDNKVCVSLNSKWGILEVLPDLHPKIVLNKGDDIPFRHQKVTTVLRMDLPVEMPAAVAKVDIPIAAGCVLDKTSRVSKDTEYGNYVQYDCDLTIPESLPDVITQLEYPVSVLYDGIQMFETKMPVRAWHVKYHNVDPIDSETSVRDGVAMFTLNINAQKNNGETDYPFDVKVQADSISVDYEKISETRYRCVVYNLHEGDNQLNIIVTEKGCPPSVFPFEITYVKPAPRDKKEETVTIRKKAPTKKEEETSLPILII